MARSTAARFCSVFSVLLVTGMAVMPLFSCAEGSGPEGAPSSKERGLFRGKDPIDRQTGLTREDYESGLRGGGQRHDSDEKSPQPVASPLLLAPKQPDIADDRLVSISITEDVPLKEVLIELSRRADVDIEIDPQITGGVIYRAKERPFSEVIESISRLAGLKYSAKNGALRIERDLPHIVNYRLNFLNSVRRANSSVNIDTTLIGDSGGGGGGSAINSGSNSTFTSATDQSDLWDMVTQGVTNILLQYQRRLSASQQGGGQAQAESGEEVKDVSSLLSVNRQTGVVAVLASEGQHREIKKYLDTVQAYSSSQVLIEAKILEVSLNDEFRSGIDWNLVLPNPTEVSARGNFSNIGDIGALSDQILSVGVLPAELLGLDNTSLEAAISLVESFGTSRTLSSPRLLAMNNQHAVLTFAENFVYFQLDVQEETQSQTTGDTTTLTVDSQIKTVPIGVILTLQPSIDTDKGEIVMSVRPTLSRITDFVEDPGVSLVAAQAGVDITSTVPVVEVREMDSVLRLRSGNVMVIGGLMEERNSNVDRGIPGLSEIPFFGNAFKSVQKVNDTVETVIFIRATIVPGQGVSAEDKKLYDTFGNSRKPL